jgi:hypothetical protein
MIPEKTLHSFHRRPASSLMHATIVLPGKRFKTGDEGVSPPNFCCMDSERIKTRRGMYTFTCVSWCLLAMPSVVNF